MEIRFILFLIAVGVFAEGFFNHPPHSRRGVVSPNSKVVYNKDLKHIDEELEKLNNQMNVLKRSKREYLTSQGSTRGLKLYNESEFIGGRGWRKGGKKRRGYQTLYDDEDDSNENDYDDDDHDDDDEDDDTNNRNTFPLGFMPSGIRVVFPNPSHNNGNFIPGGGRKSKKSENFEIIYNNSMNFNNIGGYDMVKKELMQCADMLVNYEKYAKYNVRTPKGLILEGPPGNGKTLLAKCFSGEIKVAFIPVSGAQFQEKYVGVGAGRIRELFKLASENKPCIIFIDEIDAVGKRRSGDENSAERDSTLNELLVGMDGFNSNNGVFIMASTNRLDLLDPALTRPGRIDKSIYVGLPDRKTREAILKIHITGKPYDNTISLETLVDMTQGLSGAEIENILNEGMLLALRENRETMTLPDIEVVINRILVGQQTTEHVFTNDVIYQIAVHEMGHAIVGIFAPEYKKLIKVSLNSWSPKTPGYTLFETSDNVNMHTKTHLFSHLMVLLGGRIAEEQFFSHAISTGASHDLEKVRDLANSMINEYGMGSKPIFQQSSSKYKESVDQETEKLIEAAYSNAKYILSVAKPLIHELALILMEEKVVSCEYIMKKINNKYPNLLLAFLNDDKQNTRQNIIR